ncbi:MAG: hypothetical protein ACI9XO_003450 [Paraglaciecola sp.]
MSKKRQFRIICTLLLQKKYASSGKSGLRILF